MNDLENYRLLEFILADETDAPNHDLKLKLNLEDSIIDRGMMETSSSAHKGQTRFSLVLRRVALQKHDLHSAKCRPDVLLSRIKSSITILFVDILLSSE